MPATSRPLPLAYRIRTIKSAGGDYDDLGEAQTGAAENHGAEVHEFDTNATYRAAESTALTTTTNPIAVNAGDTLRINHGQATAETLVVTGTGGFGVVEVESMAFEHFAGEPISSGLVFQIFGTGRSTAYGNVTDADWIDYLNVNSLNLGGKVSNAEFFRVFMGAPGTNPFLDLTTAVKVHRIALNEEFARAYNLWIDVSFDYDAGNIYGFAMAEDTNVGAGLLIRCDNSFAGKNGLAAAFLGFNAVDCFLLNSVVYGSYRGVRKANTIQGYALNVLAYNHENAGFSTATGSGLIAVNCMDLGSPTGFHGTYPGTCSNNSAEDATAPGANAEQGTAAILDPSNQDFRLGFASPVGVGTGLDLSGYGALDFSDDFREYSRASNTRNWDRGPHRLDLPILTNDRRRRT